MSAFELPAAGGIEPVAGMQAWYDAADTGTLTITSNKVSQWNDKSGNGHHLTQGTAADRPLYDASPRTIRGITVPEFTTSAEFMTSTCPADDRSSTTFLVAILDTAAISGNSPIGDNEGGGNEIRMNSSGIARTLKSGVAFLSSGEAYGVAATQVCFFAQILTATTIIHHFGNHWQSMSNNDAFTAGRTLRIGMDQSGTIPWDGLIAEVLRYSTTLSDADIAQNYGYLTDKWLVAT